MKTKLKFGHLVMFFTILLSVFLGSCAKDEGAVEPESDFNSEITLKSAQMGDICDLIAGQHINVGQVIYSDDGVNLHVQYATTGNWMLSEIHFYVGNMEDFRETCTNKKAIKIGHFPYSAKNIKADTDGFIIPLEDIVKPGDDGYLVVAHAVVKNGKQEETAFAKCEYQPITTVKVFTENYWYNSVGDHFGNLGQWCYWLGTNVYEKGETIPIKGPHYSWRDEIGNVTFDDDGEFLSVTVTSDIGKLNKVCVYFGTMEGLQSVITTPDGCPKYDEFTIVSIEEKEIYDFSMPLPKWESKSFEEVFGSKRWGWLNYYKL